MIRVIDNKRIDLTDAEWELYQKIAKSYNRPNFEGKELFKGLFETDDHGLIIFLIPPSTKYASMEVYLFLMSVMVHQHLGAACAQADKLSTSLERKIREADAVIKEGKDLIATLKKS